MCVGEWVHVSWYNMCVSVCVCALVCVYACICVHVCLCECVPACVSVSVSSIWERNTKHHISYAHMSHVNTNWVPT